MRNPVTGAAAGVCLAAALACAQQIPRPSPDFAVNMPNAQPVHLSQYHGKAIVLAFILTTCPHCQKTVGILSGLQKEYAAKGLQVVACAIDEMAGMLVPDFVTRFHPGFPVGFAANDQVVAYLQHPVMYRMMMPQLVFIDKTFTIRAQHSGDEPFFKDDVQEKNLRDQIENLVKAPGPSAAVKKGRKKAS